MCSCGFAYLRDHIRFVLRVATRGLRLYFMNKTNSAAFTMQTRSTWIDRNFATVEEAVAYGMSLNVPFDVSVSSGAFVWVWEMR